MGQQPIVLSDCRIKMTANSLEKYPQGLRLVSACVSVNGKPCDMNFITNNFDCSACFCHKTSMNHFMGYLWIYAKNITDISQKTTDGGVSRPISRLAALASSGSIAFRRDKRRGYKYALSRRRYYERHKRSLIFYV